MKVVLYIVVFLLTLAVIAIGINIVPLRMNFSSKANKSCTVPVLPKSNPCAEGQQLDLTKDSTGCYVFVCK